MSILSGPASLLGIGDDHGDYYKNRELNNKGTKSLAEMLDAARGAKVNDAGMGLVKGGSLADALAGMNGDEASALGSSGIYGNIVASQQAANDPLLSGLIGKGGSRDQALAEEARLRDQGFKLTNDDHEAYGQASGNIARQFGQQEQSLASALARRGMAAGGSGAGMAQFSGLQGNKNEQLGQMQMKIANDRMQNTMKRLSDVRSYANQLGQLGLNAENSMFSHNMQGDESRHSLANTLAGNERSDYQTSEDARQKSMVSQQGAEKQNLGDALSNGIYAGVQGGTQSMVEGAMGGNASTFMGGGGGGVPGGPTNTGAIGNGGNGGYSVGGANGMYNKKNGSAF